MAVSFGIASKPLPKDEFVRWVSNAEAAGFDLVCTGDSPALLRDQYVALTLLALNTSTCKIGSFITNPVSRHPTITAGASSTLNELSNGRFRIGISTGDSGLLNLGLKRSTLARLEEYVLTMQQLWRESEAPYRGGTARLVWTYQAVPIYLAAGGPKALELAGRIADGVYITLGLTPSAIDGALLHLEKGAKQSGRTLDDLDIWWHVRANIDDDYDTSVRGCLSALGGIAHHTFQAGVEGKFLPKEFQAPIAELARRYDSRTHTFISDDGGLNPNEQLVVDLGLQDFLSHNFAMVGTPSDWISRAGELEKLGVNQLAFAAVVPDLNAFIHQVGQDVIPHLG